jgi:PAS domain S-box-containing protein
VERNEAGEALCIIGNHEDITERKQAETALRENERRYRDLFTNSPLGIFRSTFDGRFLEVNPALARMLGYDSPEAVIREIYDIQEQIYINGEKRQEIIAKQNDATGVAQYINRYRRKDGTEFTANLYLKTIRTEGGDPLYLEGIVEDITDRIRTETALRESEEKFRRCFDTDLVAIAVSRRRDGMYVEANPGFLKVTGYSYDEVVGRRACDLCFYPPSRRRSMLDELEQKDRLHNRELTFPTKDGTGRTILFSLSPLVLNGEDCLLATMVDITDRKRAEDALEKVRKRYELATRKGEVGIWDWDLKTGDVFISKNLLEMLGYADREMEEHIEAFARHIHTADLEAVVEAVNACIEGEKPDYNVEHRLVRKDGGILWVLASGKVERDDGGRPVRFVGTLTDISKRKRLQEQLQHARKMESIGTLVAGIAHEFNNLLFIILGNTELAADDAVPSGRKHAYYKTIHSACLRGKNIVTKLLTFSRTPAERKCNLNLSKLVAESRSLLRSVLAREITFETALSDECDGIYADETQVKQILLDLVRNADHAMAERGGILRIAVENATLDAPEIFVDRTLAPGNYVRLTVSDTGCGIPETNLDRVFDPFFTTKEVGCGTGLGLSAVHGIVSGHDGGIRIRSTEGRGTLVECLFPARHAADRAHETKPPEIAGGSETILYVDAESFIVNLAKTRLERKGYTVVGTTNPAAALEMITDCPDRFDLVITDLAMPAAGGEELAAVIRKRRPDLPIVICSGYGETTAEEKAREIGAHAYIMKPIGRDEFAGVVRNTLDAASGISNHR